MCFWKLVVVLLFVLEAVTSQTDTVASLILGNRISTDLPFAATGSFEKKQDSLLQTRCSMLYQNFLNEWSQGQYRLTVTLDNLKTWNCSQYELECRRQTFAYNRFTKLVYNRFCDLEAFESNCTARKSFTNAANLFCFWLTFVNT